MGSQAAYKTTHIVRNFDEEHKVVMTTTAEAAKDLRNKLAHRLGAQAFARMRIMASVLVKEDLIISQLTVGEALMNHFGAIVMAAQTIGSRGCHPH